MGKATFRTSTPPPTPLNQFGWRFEYITKSAQGVDVQNLVEIDSAVMNLRMREKTRFRVNIFINLCLRRGYRSHFKGRF